MHCRLSWYSGLMVGTTGNRNSTTINRLYGVIRQMNSKERHEARYQRRKMKRLLHKRQKEAKNGDFGKVFTFDNLYTAFRKCCLGVGWKASTQRFKANALQNVNDIYRSLHNGTYKSRGFYEFDIVERGKERHIKSVHISERVVQRCLCDNALVPMFSRSFIYDNGACMANKGIDFAVRRLTCHLQRYFRKHGTDGYALVFDFSKYFDNIAHEPLKATVSKTFSDPRIVQLVNGFIDDFGKVGLGLGSQISQVSALMYPNKLDHYIKEELRIQAYGRYMDDGYLVHESKEHLQYCLQEIRRLCAELGIKLNEKKTQIVKLSRGLNFLKRRFILTETGKVIVKPARKGITKMRRKLRTFKRWLVAGKMKMEDIRTSYTSWKGHMKQCNAYRTILSTDALFDSLFAGSAAAFDG